MDKPLVLVVDDDPAIRRMVAVLLGSEGYEVVEAGDAYEAAEQVKRALPDVILLDWMMPGLSGWDLVRRFRAEQLTRDVPVVMLTAKTEEESVVAGLKAGADDYVTKPFSGRELIARIDALLRRTQADVGAGQINVGAMTLDPSEHRLLVGGREITVSPTEFKLLHFFMKHPNKVFSRARILDHVWEVNAYVEERTVDVQIRRLRKSLESCDCGKMIETVRGVGYRLNVSSEADNPP